jgi:type I restriction enzyme S subunit
MKWPIRRIGDLVALQRGHDLTDSQRKKGSVPVIGSAGPNGFHEIARAKGPGVTIGRSGGSIGKVTFVPQDYWPHNTCIYVTDFNGNDPRFVAYLLSTIDLAQLNSGAAQPSLNRNFVYGVRVAFPEPKEQRRIADMLAAYDDSIEDNRQRMALLEQAARLLYQEWFVRLRFPGHEHTHITKGVPTGWRAFPLRDICPDLREAASPADLETDTPYIGLEHMPRRSITLNEWGRAEEVTSTKLRYRAGDILFGKIRPYFHKVGIALTDGVTSSDAIVLRPSADIFHSFALLTVSCDWFVTVVSKTAKEGSKMPRADWKLMEQQAVVVPSSGILAALNETVAPILEQLRTLSFANQKLRAARDLLLPRLMSGEIAV